jgi:HTH-type transcriptional regulator/antitoxin HigA
MLNTTKRTGKTVAAAKTRLNAAKYGRLLSRALPKVIADDEEHERMLAQIEKLMDKGEGRTPEETELLKLMVRLAQDYEDEHYPIPEAEPHEVLRHLMEARDLRQRDLVPIFGSSGRVSEAVSGRRPISKTQSKALARFFHVSPELFL